MHFSYLFSILLIYLSPFCIYLLYYFVILFLFSFFALFKGTLLLEKNGVLSYELLLYYAFIMVHIVMIFSLKTTIF